MLAILKIVDAESLRLSPKFQVNIEIQQNAALFPEYLSVSYDYLHVNQSLTLEAAA